jgi:hypothetical protein
MAIDSKHLINLKGKDYVLYAGLLAEAHALGLQSIITDLVQIPSEQNEYVAIVQATAMFPEGKVFTDYGDASPRNTSATIATALIRMASTRAKGRALRDATNIGTTMYEELPPESGDPIPDTRGDRQAAGALQRAERETVADRVQQPGPAGALGQPMCSAAGCGKALTKGQVDVSRRAFGKPLCPSCQKVHTKL